MLMIRFSVAVAKEHEEEVKRILHDEFEVEIIRSHDYNERFLESVLPMERVYIDCCMPYRNFRFVTSWLDKIFKDNALLTY